MLCMRHYEIEPLTIGHCLREFEHLGPHGSRAEAPFRPAPPALQVCCGHPGQVHMRGACWQLLVSEDGSIVHCHAARATHPEGAP